MNDYVIIRASDSDSLSHHGIKDMKWGVRRFQNKDGSLTKLGRKRYNTKDGKLNKRGEKELAKQTAKLKAEKKLLKNKERTQKKLDKAKKLESEVDDMKKADQEAKAGESRESKRERLLNSTNPKELYENRNLLTTVELDDRLKRIDTEARLASKIPQQKTGADWLNEKMSKTSTTINNATDVFRKVDSAYSAVATSSIGKQLAKQLGIKPPRKEFNLDKIWEKRNTLTDDEIKKYSQRAQNMVNLKNNRDKLNGVNTNNNNNGVSEDKVRELIEQYMDERVD